MIRIRDFSFRYPRGDFQLDVPALDVARGERIAIVGASGSGKTTLLDVIGGIHPATAGRVTVDGADLGTLSEAARRSFRVRGVGLIFQAFELLEYLTVRDNILLPYRISSELRFSAEAAKRAGVLADSTGIAPLLDSHPDRLSQGERQRAAICRALITEPALILADEPTGNLDPANKLRVLDILLREVERNDATLVMVTHDHDLLTRFDRVVDMREFA